jgi:hypothetical protein
MGKDEWDRVRKVEIMKWDEETYDLCSPSREPLDGPIFDEELGKVLTISKEVD